MKELPENLEAVPAEDLARQAAHRDRLLAPLFRRWPALSRVETRRLKGLYAERVRLAKHLGRRRRQRAGSPRP